MSASPFPSPSRSLPALAVQTGGAVDYNDPALVSDLDLTPPLPRSEPTVTSIHGEIRIDEYAWLRHRDDPAVVAHLEAENRHTERAMRATEPLQERLYQEMRGRIRETDLSVPERRDGWLYYTRTEAGVQYPIFCRRRDEPDAPEQILLDVNQLASGHAYFRLGAFEPSPDHRLLAYSSDTTGSESFTLVIRDLETGEHLPEAIGNTSHSIAWANDSRTLYYVVLDGARRPCRLFRHVVAGDPAGDELVHFEPDESFFLDIGVSRSRRYLLLELASHSASEVHVADADDPRAGFRVVEPRRPNIEYGVTHHGDRFYIVTNDAAPNFRLVSAPVDAPGREYWTDVLPYRPAVKLDSVDAFRGHLAVWEREAGLRQIRILDLGDGTEHAVEFPEPVYTVRQHANPEFDSRVLRFSYTSLVTSNSVVDYDMSARTWTVRKQTEVLGGFDPSCYRSERLLAPAPDGMQVPVSLVYRLPFERGGERPLLLNGYGAYGISYDPAFSSSALSLLDRGWIVAIGHVRGGEDMGRGWYEDGKLLKKRNSFTDFIAAAEHLVAEGYTSPERLAIAGGSAGGLLMGAVTNMRPDLFRAVVAEVPFVDVVNTMLDASLPLTVIEYDEWGNPNEREFYEYIRSYSPYDNIESKDYPHILVTAGLNDPRVAYWEPAKWTARLRARKTDRNRLLLRTNMGAGHGGASGRYDHLREVAFKYAFLIDTVGQAGRRAVGVRQSRVRQYVIPRSASDEGPCTHRIPAPGVTQITAPRPESPHIAPGPFNGGPLKVRDIMTPDPACCLRDSLAGEAAGLMRQYDCGAIPVVEGMDRRKLVGIVTDRDLAVRGLAEGKGPDAKVSELMTEAPVAADPDDEIETVREVMIREQVRRVPVARQDGILVGIIAQADLAREDAAASDREVGRIVEAISEPNPND